MRKGITGVLLALALTIGAGSRAQYDRDYFYYVGRSFMIDNNFEDAIRTLNILLRFDDDAYEGYFLRGIAKYNLDDLLGAEADFTTAIEKNPVFTTAFTYRAITRSRLGNYDKEIPYSCEIEIEEYREEPGIDRISAVIYVARNSQKGILIGHKGEKLKKVGRQAREELEEFLRKKVFLQLFVKVSEDWRNDQRQLRRFGYDPQ